MCFYEGQVTPRGAAFTNHSEAKLATHPVFCNMVPGRS